MDHPARSSSELYPSPKRVRVMLGGTVIADSRRVILLRRENGPPTYYFPLEDVRQELLEAKTMKVGQYGDEQWYTVRSDGREATDAAWSLLRHAGLENCVAFSWDAMDAWFEEDQEVFVHPRDPRRRIDIAASSAHVRVAAAEEVVAESRRPLLLFETGLVTRYYLSKLDVRMELLVPSDTVTYCPYKGEAHYYSLIVGGNLLEDVIWYYRYPTVEVAPIAGLLCFYQEKINVEVDGHKA